MLFSGTAGWPGRPHRELHIASHQFDEPQGCKIATGSKVVIAIHGRADGQDAASAWMDGLDQRPRSEIELELTKAGFAATSIGHDLPARHPENICNKGSSKAGAQLEIPRILRERLQKNPKLMDAFTSAVRMAIRHAEFKEAYKSC